MTYNHYRICFLVERNIYIYIHEYIYISHINLYPREHCSDPATLVPPIGFRIPTVKPRLYYLECGFALEEFCFTRIYPPS